jgi:glycosyltransferase involved in cell wall biosynthesis
MRSMVVGTDELARARASAKISLVHITESHEAKAGGIPVVVDQLARQTARVGLGVEILSVGRNPMDPPPGVKLTNVPPGRVAPFWGWSRDLRRKVYSIARRSNPQLVHVHGVWLASHWYGAQAARKMGMPFILSAHGQLEPYHWRDKGVLQLAKKRLYWHAVAYPAFRRASVIHAITRLEGDHLAQLFPDQRIEIIPNAVDLDEVDKGLGGAPLSGRTGRTSTIAFLGRFHPKKGLELLIEAFAAAQLPAEWSLMLAGPSGEPAYMSRLCDVLARSGEQKRIRLVGPLTNSSKWEFYRSATVVAVPSQSEVVGMVNLEAAACGTPTITTYETGLDDWEGSGGGMLIRPDARELASALQKLCSLSAREYEARSAASRRLVEDRYSWGAVLARWLRLYDSLL